MMLWVRCHRKHRAPGRDDVRCWVVSLQALTGSSGSFWALIHYSLMWYLRNHRPNWLFPSQAAGPLPSSETSGDQFSAPVAHVQLILSLPHYPQCPTPFKFSEKPLSLLLCWYNTVLDQKEWRNEVHFPKGTLIGGRDNICSLSFQGRKKRQKE